MSSSAAITPKSKNGATTPPSRPPADAAPTFCNNPRGVKTGSAVKLVFLEWDSGRGEFADCEYGKK
jgi:hypothetical protein